MSRIFTPAELQSRAEGLQTRTVARATPILIVALCVSVFACVAIGTILENSPTIDEPIHLLAGYSYLKWGDYRVNPEHPPLAKIVAALPLLAFDIRDPRAASEAWNEIPAQRPGIPAGRVALQMFFAENDAETLFFYGKLPFVFLAAILGLCIFLWTEEAYGQTAAVAALILFTTNPTVIAHSTVIHTDVAFSLCFFLGTWFFCKSLRCGRWIEAVLACFIFGLATVTKFSAIGIFISWSMIGVLWWVGGDAFPVAKENFVFGVSFRTGRGQSRERSAAGRFVFLGIILAGAAAAALLSIWAAYSFRFSAIPDGGAGFSFDKVWSPAIPRSLRAAAMTAIRHRLLPEAWIYGQLYNIAFIHRGSYLLGELSDHGFWSYFLIAVAVKTPVPVLVLIGLAIANLFRRGEWKKLESYSLWVPVVVYFGLAVSAGMNIGIRHILPIFPFLFVLAGASVARLVASAGRYMRSAVIFLFLWMCWNAVSAYPDYFAFFNELVSFKSQRPALIDSNLDWGQDLKRLKTWLDEHGIRKTLLVYFGMAEPAYYGIDAVALPGAVFPPRLAVSRPSDALPYALAISANHFYAPRIYSMPAEQAFVESFHLTKPDARVGHSILIFNLDPADPQVNLSLGRILALNGEPALAKKALEKIPPDSRLAVSASDLLKTFDTPR